MADTKVTALTELTTPAGVDLLYIVDDPAGTPLSRKVTVANLFANASPITIASGTLTASAPALNVTQTWNNAGVTFTGLSANVTDTASNAASLLMDLQVGGVSRFGIDKAGTVITPSVIATNTVIAQGASGNNAVAIGSFTSCTFTNIGKLRWASGTNAAVADNFCDLFLYRDAANTLALRNGANAQTFRTYGTYTDASNYRRVAISMTTAGVASIAPEGAGTGASGNVLHISGLPTSNPGPGILWNNAGTVEVGT